MVDKLSLVKRNTEEIIGEAVRLAREAIREENRTFCLNRPLSRQQVRDEPERVHLAAHGEIAAHQGGLGHRLDDLDLDHDDAAAQVDILGGNAVPLGEELAPQLVSFPGVHAIRGELTGGVPPCQSHGLSPDTPERWRSRKRGSPSSRRDRPSPAVSRRRP